MKFVHHKVVTIKFKLILLPAFPVQELRKFQIVKIILHSLEFCSNGAGFSNKPIRITRARL